MCKRHCWRPFVGSAPKHPKVIEDAGDFGTSQTGVVELRHNPFSDSGTMSNHQQCAVLFWDFQAVARPCHRDCARALRAPEWRRLEASEVATSKPTPDLPKEVECPYRALLRYPWDGLYRVLGSLCWLVSIKNPLRIQNAYLCRPGGASFISLHDQVMQRRKHKTY